MRKKCANMWSKTHKEKSQLRHTSTSLILPPTITQNPGHYISNKVKTGRYRKPERKEKKKKIKAERWREGRLTKERQVLNSLGFLFDSFPNNAEETGNPKFQVAPPPTAKSLSKSFLQPKDQEKSSLARKHHLDITALYPKQTPQKKPWPHHHPHQRRLNGEPRLLPSPG